MLISRRGINSDKDWIDYAIKRGDNIKLYGIHNNIIFSTMLKGPNTNPQIIKMDDSITNILMKVCNHIGVDYPGLTDSLKRDYCLIADAKSLYLTGYFDLNKSRLQLRDYENWIVEMFITKHKSLLLPVYLYSEHLKCWCQLDYSTLKWIYIMRPPKPSGVYIGICSPPVSSAAQIEISLL